MSEVIDIRPEVSAQREITPYWIECRVEEFMRECDLIGIPVAMGLYIDDVPHVRLNHTAAFNPHVMSGVLDDVKDVLRGVGLATLEEIDEDEDKG